MWGHSGLHADVWQLVEATTQTGELTQNIYQLPHTNKGAFKAPAMGMAPQGLRGIDTSELYGFGV